MHIQGYDDTKSISPLIYNYRFSLQIIHWSRMKSLRRNTKIPNFTIIAMFVFTVKVLQMCIHSYAPCLNFCVHVLCTANPNTLYITYSNHGDNDIFSILLCPHVQTSVIHYYFQTVQRVGWSRNIKQPLHKVFFFTSSPKVPTTDTTHGKASFFTPSIII